MQSNEADHVIYFSYEQQHDFQQAEDRSIKSRALWSVQGEKERSLTEDSAAI